MSVPSVDLNAKIPNNVGLSDDPKVRRALEHWQPKYLEWWRDMGPSDFSEREVYLRTAVSVEPGGWAHWEHVRMPEYRWGVFLTPHAQAATIHVGDESGAPAWDEVPGEHRAALRRIIVTQADTEPASVEQQRLLGHMAPSLYDMRNLFQVNVEEGRHLWAMVYLLHKYFGKDGRDEAEALLAAPLGRPRPPADPRRVQPALRSLAVVLLLHHVRRPRRQVPARRPARERVRPAGALLRVHAHRGGVPPVRRRDRGWSASSGAPPSWRRSTPTATCGVRAASTLAPSSARSTTGLATASTCSAASCPTTPPLTSAPASRAASRRPSATATTRRSRSITA
jgi:hypothetical protein